MRNKRKTRFVIKLINTRPIQMIADTFLVTVSVSLMIMPSLIIGFNKVNIANLIIVIFTSFIIGPIMIVGILFVAIKISFVEEILAFLLKILIDSAKFGASLPLNQIYFITPSIFQVLIYYILIFTLNFLIKINLEKNPNLFQRRIKNLISLAKYRINLNKKKIISSFLIISLIFSLVSIFAKNLKIYFVDVGQRRLHFNCNSAKRDNFNRWRRKRI